MESRTAGRGNRGRARGIPPQQEAPASRRPRPPQGVSGGRPAASLFQGPPPQQGPSSALYLRRQAPLCPPVMLSRGFRGLEDGQVTEDIVQVQHSAQFKLKQGVASNAICLKTNYFQLMSVLNQYCVDFNPPIEDTKARKKLVANGIRPFNVTGYIFDGTLLYTPNRLRPEPCEFVAYDETSQLNIKVEIRLVGELHQGDYQYLQLLNIIIKKCSSYMDLQVLGKNDPDPNLKASIRECNLKLWPGFLTSMRRYQESIMLTGDLAIKVMRSENLFDLLLDCRSSCDPKKEFERRVIGAIVLTEYNNKTYRIDSVDFERTANDSFTKCDGSQISICQYFQEKFKVKIRCKEQPLLISKPQVCEIRAGMPENLVLLPELCVMTGLTEKQRKNCLLMKAMGKYTHIKSEDRMRKLLQFAERVRASPTALQEIRRWDFKLANDLIEFQGRVLPSQSLALTNTQPIQGGEEVDWRLGTAPMYNIFYVQKIAIIVPARLAEGAQDFGHMLSNVGHNMSMIIHSKLFSIPDDRIQSYLSEIEKIDVHIKPSMVIVVLSKNSGDRYNAIKKKCYLDNALPCQVMVAKNLTRRSALSIATNIAVQMGCKVGVAPWATILSKNTMVVGFEICNDSNSKSTSFVGMVASMDQACTQYYSMVTQREFDQELGPNISCFIQLACKQYQERNREFPERIIIYQGGVGDEEIPYVKEHEVESIKAKLQEELYKDVPLKMAFIVVSKRISKKNFRTQAGPKNEFNPPPGTVVDDFITQRYDFYIVSNSVREATVSPTSYNIIENTLGVDANNIQRFTFKLCYMYFNNCSETARVPAPCRYAHKLAFLTAHSLHRPASSALNNTPYYM